MTLSPFAESLVGKDFDRDRVLRAAETARQTGVTLVAALQNQSDDRLSRLYARLAEDYGFAILYDKDRVLEQAQEADEDPDLLAAGREMGVLILPSQERQNGRRRPHVALTDPTDLGVRDWLRDRIGADIAFSLIEPKTFKDVRSKLAAQSDDFNMDDQVIHIDVTAADEQMILADTGAVDTPRIVNWMLWRSFRAGSSDIHVEPTEGYLVIRNRIDGILHEERRMPLERHAEISSRLKIIAGMDVAEKRRPQDGRIGVVIDKRPIDIRVSSFPTIHGEKLVMRLLDRSALRPSPSDLGLKPRDLTLLLEKVDAPFGLVMISGPTGSGKTTTLYSCLSHIDKDSRNVLTVEDPVEYRLAGVHQMQVNERIGLTFAAGLRTILRQDPDVIMVGECRDEETAAMAIQSALTGHIVFSTIHTNDAIGVITRLLDIGIDRFLVANALTLAVAQRLVRRICPHCPTIEPGKEIRQRLHRDGITDARLRDLALPLDDKEHYAVEQGCPACRHTGYLGRQPVFEVFEMTNDARTMILDPDFNADRLRQAALQDGMTTLIRHGISLIEGEKTTHEEIIRVLGETY